MPKSSRGGQGARKDGGSIAQSSTGVVINTQSSIPAPVQTVRNHTQFTDTDASQLIAANVDA